jgi:PAS domain S-box-containing protein
MAESLRIDEESISATKKALGYFRDQTVSCSRTASDLEILERLYEVGNQCALLDSDFTQNLNNILDAAIFITTADRGAIQLCAGTSGGLINAVQRGFERPFLNVLSLAEDESASPWGAALRCVQQVLVEDVTRSEYFAGHPALNVVLAAGVRAVLFIPLVSRTGKVLGMLSTHFRQPTRLMDRQIRFMDLLAQQAADYLERNQNEETLKAKQNQLDRIAGNVPVLITQCSRDLRYVFVNKAGLDVLGKPLEQIVGRPIVEVLGEEHFQKLRPYMDRVLSGEQVEYEMEIPYATGDAHYMHVAYVPEVDAQGGVVGWIGTFTDITERRRAEQKLRDKDQFLAMLAHELRNPLAPISAGIELLQGKTDPETSESTLSLLGHQVQHMGRLLDDLLDVSRVTLGKVELRKECIQLNPVVEQALQSSHSLIHTMNHRVTLALTQESLYVKADRVRLVQVICNLLNNACKYMDRGGSIALTVARIDDQALISVRDRGVGFASEDASRMFELFAQLDTSCERSVGGLGVGLTLAKAVVEQHGGTIDARSEGRGHGSEFVVRLPITNEEPKQREVLLDEPGLTIQRRILIVEDRREIAKALTRLLEANGHTTHVAYDGQQGVEAAREFRPDIVLVDVGLPELDGYETCRRIRSEQWGQHMVLVALTGYGQAADVRAAKAAGFNHYLLKPVLYQVLAKVFAGVPCDDDKLAFSG